MFDSTFPKVSGMPVLSDDSVNGSSVGIGVTVVVFFVVVLLKTAIYNTIH